MKNFSKMNFPIYPITLSASPKWWRVLIRECQCPNIAPTCTEEHKVWNYVNKYLPQILLGLNYLPARKRGTEFLWQCGLIYRMMVWSDLLSRADGVWSATNNVSAESAAVTTQCDWSILSWWVLIGQLCYMTCSYNKMQVLNKTTITIAAATLLDVSLLKEEIQSRASRGTLYEAFV